MVEQYGGIFRRPSDLAGRPPELAPTAGRPAAPQLSGAGSAPAAGRRPPARYLLPDGVLRKK